jgi:predicted dehydrogenase
VSGRPRWGIVGTGGISRSTVGDLHLTENLDLVAVASRTADNAAAFAAEHEVPSWYGGYDALFAADDVDAVYIGTPIGTHFDVARRALAAGKHVVLEKAFTTTADEARQLAAHAAERGRFLMEAMWMRFNPAFRRMLAEVADGAIGDVRSVQAAFGFPAPPHFIHWRPELGGGALLDMGVYPLTLAHALLGVPQSVEATGELRDDGLDLTASAFLRYGDGRFAHALTSLRSFIGAGATIGGSRGFITYDHPFLSAGAFRVETPPHGTPRTVTVDLEGRGYVPMFRAASEAIADGLLEHPLRPLADTIAVLETMDEIRRQLGAGQSASG